MFPKLVFLTLMLVCLAGGLLGLRQHRLELAHQNADLFAHILATRQNLWEAQARGAALLQPQQIEKRVQQVQLVLEPVDPMPLTQPEQGFARQFTGTAPLRVR